MSSPDATQQKIQRFTAFLNHKLYPDLHRTNTRLTTLHTQHATYTRLLHTLTALVHQYDDCKDTGEQHIKTLTNIGHDIYASAHITPSTTPDIYINIGCNILLAMTPAEAVTHVQHKLRSIQAMIDRCNTLAASIKTQTKTVYEAINELIALTSSTQAGQRT